MSYTRRFRQAAREYLKRVTDENLERMEAGRTETMRHLGEEPELFDPLLRDYARLNERGPESQDKMAARYSQALRQNTQNPRPPNNLGIDFPDINHKNLSLLF